MKIIYLFLLNYKLDSLNGFQVSHHLISNDILDMPRGHYLFILFHYGFGTMAQFTFINLTGHSESTNDGHFDNFFDSKNLSSNMDEKYYNIKFNPVKCQIKLNTLHYEYKELVAIKFI